MQYWRPVPQALITDTLIHRWTKDNPAPDLVGFLVAFDRLMAGTPWSARKLAVYAGWSRWRANQTLQAARDFQAEWQELNRPLFTESARPPEVSDSGQIGNQSGQKPAGN